MVYFTFIHKKRVAFKNICSYIGVAFNNRSYMLHHLKTELPDRDDVDSILLEALNKRRDIYVCIKG